jgi:hypothetical protein
LRSRRLVRPSVSKYFVFKNKYLRIESMPVGGQKGNNNAARGSEWREAVVRAIKRGKGLDQLAEVLVAKALDGDMVALKEVGDRLDGKPKQQVDVTVQDAQPTGPNADTLSQRLAIQLAGRAGTADTPNTVQ